MSSGLRRATSQEIKAFSWTFVVAMLLIAAGCGASDQATPAVGAPTQELPDAAAADAEPDQAESQPEASEPQPEASETAGGSPLLNGDFTTLSGESINLASLQGQDVVFWFWAPW